MEKRLKKYQERLSEEWYKVRVNEVRGVNGEWKVCRGAMGSGRYVGEQCWQVQRCMWYVEGGQIRK